MDSAMRMRGMYASHTLIAYPIISRYGLSRQRTVSITIRSEEHTSELQSR